MYNSSTTQHFGYLIKPYYEVRMAENEEMLYRCHLLHFVAFFHVASLFSTGVDNKKGGVDNEKALELTNSTVFHRGRQ